MIFILLVIQQIFDHTGTHIRNVSMQSGLHLRLVGDRIETVHEQLTVFAAS